MRFATFLLAAASAADLVAGVKFVSAPEGWSESLNFTVRDEDFAKYIKRDARSATLTPKIQPLTARVKRIANSKTVKIRYGPYNVPAPRVPGGEGMINNMPTPSVDKPCQDCMILGMNAGLEYPDGSDANTDTKMWLHHMVMFNIGKNANDATCTIFGAPHLIVGSMPSSSERIFSSGNERTTTFFNPPWASDEEKLGYPIYPADRFGMIVDLMNMNPGGKQVYLTIYYDYVDGHPAGFGEVKPVWMDAAQCGTSEVSGRGPNARFDFKSPPWITNFEGEVMGAGGHLHDGGTHVEILVDGKVICDSVPTYGTDEEAIRRANIAKAGGMAPGTALPAPAKGMEGMDMKGMKGMTKGVNKRDGPGGHQMSKQHIIAMSICAENKASVKDIPISPLSIKELKKGQSWILRAYYDYTKFPAMNKGASNTPSSVMGISIMYAKTKNKRVAR
ncbi:hypothetical protein FKW77_001278 [Venturia effusa]|uniref:Uncharacterized protein n=1 Tax=Venturia effusa TaxID=50376 RepID=A0A517LI39_9PEZI|nr:hypothetical protein FKW77_001278 [Venturia effusa]